MALLLALGAGLSFGAADFVGGFAAKRTPAATVTFLSQVAGFTILLVALPFVGGDVSLRALGFGAAAGIAGSLGLVAYLKALAAGPMGLVAPITSVVGVGVPVVVGLAAGEHLSALATAGLVLGLVAIGVVAGGGGRNREAGAHGPLLAIVGGLMVGTFLVLLDQTPDGSGLWPLVGARVASLTMLGTWAFATKATLPSRADLRPIALSGVLDMSANVLFLLAARAAPLTLASLLTSMSPVVIVLLARQVLAERLHKSQIAAVALSLVAIAAVTIG
jgi:drug/metabolite transporter (DMT)-like permease